MLKKQSESSRKLTGTKLWRKIALMLLLVVLILAIALGYLIRASRNADLRVDSKVTTFELKDIGELSTQSGYFTVVNVIDDAKKLWKWTIPFTSSKYIFSYDGVVRAGIDFAEVELDIDDVSKTVTVKLPETKIFEDSTVLKEDSLKIYDERQSIFTPLSLTDVQASRQEMLAEIETTAKENGLLEEARDNAKVLIQGFLSATYSPSEYSFVFE